MNSPTATLTNIQETVQETILDNTDITEMDSFIPKDLEKPVIGIAVSHHVFCPIPSIEDILSFFLSFSLSHTHFLICSFTPTALIHYYYDLFFGHRLFLQFSCFWVY
jgi:hypothetical protein